MMVSRSTTASTIFLFTSHLYYFFYVWIAAATTTTTTTTTLPTALAFTTTITTTTRMGRAIKKAERRKNQSSSLTQKFASTQTSATPDALWPALRSPSPSPPPQNTKEHDNDDNDNDNTEEADFGGGYLSQSIFDSILIIHCTHREPDYQIPWQNVHQSTSTSSGFVIDVPRNNNNNDDNNGDDDDDDVNNKKRMIVNEKRIMTNAHSVEYGSIVQVQRRGDSQKFVAKVEAIGQECDLALLHVEDEDFWNGFDDIDNFQHLTFGSLPELQDDVEVLGYPTGGDSLSVTSGVVSRIEMQEYAQAGVHLLAMQIDAAINAGNSGGPVIDMDGNVVGVAFQSLESAENIGYVVPVPVVQHFLEDIRRNNGRYTGFTSFGMRLSILENEAMRKSLGMMATDNTKTATKKKRSGVLVRKMSALSPAKDIILPNDVIMELDGISVANDGKIPYRPGERVSLICYLQTKFAGDMIHLKLLRDKKEIEVHAPVGILKDLVPMHWNSLPPPYTIAGGLVFTALSYPYLNAGEAYESYISDDVSYLLGLLNADMEREGDEVVILCQVLAHRSNLGYEHFSDLHLKTLNGEKIRSLRQLQSLIDECKEEYLKFEFAPGGRIIVLERASLDEATSAVCEEHSIREPFRLKNYAKEEKK